MVVSIPISFPSALKFLFAIQNPAHFINYRNVAERLLADGHQVVFHLEKMGKSWVNLTDKPLADLSLKYPDSFSYTDIVRTSGVTRKVLYTKREIVNYGGYLKKENPISTAEFPKNRAEGKIPPKARRLLRFRIISKALFSRFGWYVMDLLEKIFRPDRDVTTMLARQKPDMVIASPYIFPHSEQIEYIKASNRMNIPTVVGVASWDNLTTKGLFQVEPNMVMVWNQAQVKELEQIHKIDPAKVITTGAPSLDIWFDMEPDLDSGQFRKSCGLAGSGPFITYLCSSKSITRTEDVFIENLSARLKARLGEASPSILVRPHPENMDIWRGRRIEGAIVYPASYDEYYSREAKKVFFHSLYHCSCVVGLNTTAIIESAIVGKPIVSISDESFADTHTQSAHFNHLLCAGFMVMADGLDEAVDRIAEAVDGSDDRSEQRSRFVEDFVRPMGIERSSSAIMAGSLVAAASGESPESIRAAASMGEFS